jgi:aconitase A
MMRGTFANVRIKNLMAPGTEGGVTVPSAVRRADEHLRCLDPLPVGRHRRS